ncbi:MAG: type II secretion system F family protein [Pseudomonadota bacterium]
MPQFSYKAIGRDGKSMHGVVEADGMELASRQLKSQGLTLLALESGAREHGDSGKLMGKAPGRDEVLGMTNELAVMLRAGLPLDRSLKVLIDMASLPAMNQLLNELLSAVKGGKAFSQALQPHEALFGTFYISMVRAGEASGQLSQVLDRLVGYLESSKANRDSVVSALIYPTILLTVSMLSIVLMLGFVVPQFQTLFEDMGEGLPVLTRMVIDSAEFVKSYGWLLLLIAVGAVFIFRRWLATDEGRLKLHSRVLRTPVLGRVIFEFEVSKFARTAGTLLGNGVSLLKAISIAIDTVGNQVLKDALQVLPPAVKAGKRISIALEDTQLFSPMVIQMIRVGEESGALDEMLLELAKVFDDKVQSGIKRGLALVEPVLILGMGVVIAILIIAILMGILSVNDLAM